MSKCLPTIDIIVDVVIKTKMFGMQCTKMVVSETHALYYVAITYYMSMVSTLWTHGIGVNIKICVMVV